MKDHQQKTVAIVDEDTNMGTALSRLLRAVGIPTKAYHSTDAFLEDLTQPDPDCLVLDLHLDGLAGFNLQRHLHEAGRRLPVVFFSNHDEPETHARAERSGCVAFFRRSDSGLAVIEAIERAFGLADHQPHRSEPM